MSNVLNGLSAVETLAVMKMVKKAQGNVARDEVKVGSHEVNCLIRVQGTVKVGEDYDKDQVNTIDWTGLFALALSKLNGTTVESLVTEFLETETVDVKDLKAQAKAKIDQIKGITSQTDRGKVTTKVTFKGVESVEMVKSEVASNPKTTEVTADMN